MLCIVREQPVRPAGNSGEEYGNVRFVPDEMAAGPDERRIWVWHHFGICELDQPAILFDEFIGFQRWKSLRVNQQILFHFIPHDFRKH